MHTRRVLSLTALLCALLLLPLAADAANARGQGAGANPEALLGNPRALARYLRLTPAQVEQARQLREELRTDVEPLRETGKALREALADELDAAPQNACEVGQAAIAVHDNHAQIRAAQEEFDEAFSAILTPAQLARYEALKEAVRLLRGGEEEN